jgi:hypothetical protein
MITCPNCGKQNADEAVHCGFCGHQLQEGGKKTLFGMSALDPEMLKKAAEEAKQRQAVSAPAEDPGPPMPTSIPKLNLPKPSPSFDAFSATEAMPAVKAPNPSVGGAPAKDPFMDEFAALEAQFGHEFAPSKPPPSAEDDDDAGAPTELHDTSSLLDESDRGPRPSDMPTPMFDLGAKPLGDPFAPPSGPPAGDPFAPPSGPPTGDPFAPPSGPPAGDPFAPPSSPPPFSSKPAADPFAPPAGGPPAGGVPAPLPAGQVAKKDNTMLLIGGGLLLLGVGGCVIVAIAAVVFGLF